MLGTGIGTDIVNSAIKHSTKYKKSPEIYAVLIHFTQNLCGNAVVKIIFFNVTNHSHGPLRNVERRSKTWKTCGCRSCRTRWLRWSPDGGTATARADLRGSPVLLPNSAAPPRLPPQRTAGYVFALRKQIEKTNKEVCRYTGIIKYCW